MRSRHLPTPPQFVGLLLLGLLAVARPTSVRGDCPFCIDGFAGPTSQGPNVRWSSGDSLTVCPGGDSVIVNDPLHLHPSRLRVGVEYFDNNCSPRVKVSPDSIWVTYAISSGNLLVNDQGSQTFADDSTDGCGFARVTIPSFSGCGTLSVYLYVSGVLQGSRLVTIRSTDTDADGRTLGFDTTTPCDLNYDGAITSADVLLVNAHLDHWRRNALHGAMVRRTNYCESCPEETPGTKGGSEIFWSPSGRYISHTQFIQVGQDVACKVFIVPSDPRDGNALTQFSFAPYSDHDYDPSWSPRNDYIAWDRNDRSIIRKRVPWSGDPTEVVVTTSNNSGCTATSGDNNPAISPDGEWVAFSRCNPDPPGGHSIWKIPINGGTAIQLTPTLANASDYPTWSPDGQTIYFQRQDAVTFGDSRWTLWKVPAAGGTAQQVLVPPGSPLSDAIQPALSPDSKILLTGYGVRDLTARNVISRTLDPALSSPTAQKVVPNYPDTIYAEKGAFPELSPRLSPDGTRTALGSKQIWAVRRNMNLPPRFTTFTLDNNAPGSLADTAATNYFDLDLNFHTIVVSATDPEGDALTYRASFLQSWMTWNAAQRRLTLSAPSSAQGKLFYVKFWVTTPSGGTDSFIAVLAIQVPLGPSAARLAPADTGATALPLPEAGVLALVAPSAPDGRARLAVFDVSGRRVAAIDGRSGSTIVWDGRDERTHSPVSTGIYFYRMEAGPHRREGKVAVVR